MAGPKAYDAPNFTVIREQAMASTGGLSTIDYAPFHQFQKFTLKGVHHVVVSAGTATGRSLVVFASSTAIGSVDVKGCAAGTKQSVTSFTPADIDSLQELKIQYSSGATGTGFIVYEYTTDHDSTPS